MVAKPSSKPDWTVTNPSFGSVTVEPSAGKKITGWTSGEKPAYQFMNWLFYNLGEWLDYFEFITDAGVSGAGLMYQAYVGSLDGCTHATLAAALADAAIAAGDRILVVSDETLNDTIQVTKNGVEIHFHSRVTFSKGTAVTGLQISADRVKVTGGRFSGFSTAGDKAVLIDAGSDYTMIRDTRFASCDTDVDDLAGTSSITGTITE